MLFKRGVIKLFTLVDLALAFGISLLFIIVFKIHREILPGQYFSMSEIIYGFQLMPTKLAVVIRVLIIFIFGLVLSAINLEPKIILLGLTLGSFLIVWPGFLSEENIDERVIDKKTTLYSLFILFILSTLMIAKLSIVGYSLGEELITMYIHSFNKDRIIALVGDFIVTSLILLFLGYLIVYIRKYLSTKLFRNNDIEVEKAYFEGDFDSEVASAIEEYDNENG